MREPEPFVFPDITEDDIAWACDVMELPNDAFDGARRHVLLTNGSLDVAACPGSGKTTLLVAKLAILARKWTDRRRGICVLSHTNAAREVIEDRLGATAEGQSLLSYPHYVGTIHGFVDRFLGIPYLRHKGWEVLVDNERCFVDIEGKLNFVDRYTRQFKSAYRQLNHRNQNKFFKLRLKYAGGAVAIVPECGENHLGIFPNGTTLNEILRFQQKLKVLVSKSGVHAYDDMFVYGHRLLDNFPFVKSVVSERFPILFIDEAQDNSELQSYFLHRLFVDENEAVVSQRFGDANQAIYHGMGSEEVAETWTFPDPNIKHDVADSHRFGQTIANFAQPLEVDPQALTGRGPDQRKVTADVDDQHTIFLFADQAYTHVLPAYVSHLQAIFDLEALEKGSFVAVGAKHNKPNNENNKPNSVWDYWEGYDPEQNKSDPRPDTFVGFIHVGLSKREKSTDQNLHHAVEQIATGLLEAVRRAGGKPSRRQRKNIYIREVLMEHEVAFKDYLDFVRRFAVDGEALSQENWDNEWKAKLASVAEVIFDGDVVYAHPAAFFEWPVGDGAAAEDRTSIIFQQGEGSPKVKLGSIHSVKGETHTGVLVLETYNQTHVLKKIKRWLLGNPGTEMMIDQQAPKLKVHYVAMTRPTHLLCLAVPDSTFEVQEIATLNDRNWRIARIDNTGAVTWDEEPVAVPNEG